MTETDLIRLREAVARELSGKRLRHTYAVEDECQRLGELFSLSEEDSYRLRVAALLHDITKQKSNEEQLALCLRHGIPHGEDEHRSPKLFHAVTGAVIARLQYSEWADSTVCEAIACHTAGKVGMSLFEKLLYLADYIEQTRSFSDCVKLRSLFYDGLPNGHEARLAHLDRILLISFDMTVAALLEEGAYLGQKTVEARNALLLACRAQEKRNEL